MTTVDRASRGTQPSRRRSISPLWAAVAGVLMVGSGVVQVAASLQRWVWFRDDRASGEFSIEDHIYDYSYPAEPWGPVGSAAELFGLGYLALAVGVIAAVAASRASGVALPLVAVVAGSFALDGGHALLSGVAGAPSPIEDVMNLQWLVSSIACLALVLLAALVAPVSRAFAIASLFLVGNTAPGYLVAIFAIAPAIAGYQSYDTTPWTETVVAISAGAAGIVMLVAAARSGSARRDSREVSTSS